MAPIFCYDCGNILDISMKSTVDCACCGRKNQNLNRFETTISQSSNFPSFLRDKLTSKTQTLTAKDFENTRLIERECPECHAKVMTWSEAQMRSADEGTTIFYRCVCGYRGKEDN
ncbi:DNA-directed RNA polymerase I subunit RPA12 [Erysiphe necator]|nr:DNA-directed RNA polymerase I subunit RPA12 [Erysiphe necator]